MPGTLDVGTERKQAFTLGLRQRRVRARRQRVALVLKRADGKQALVPALLQLGGDEAVVGIDGIILATRVADLVASLFQRQLDLSSLVLACTAADSLCRERCLDSDRL